MNWGKGLIIGMAMFMVFIIAMVVAMFNQPADDYDKQYYEKGLAYDSTYNKEKQVVTDNAKPLINITGNNLVVVFTAPAKGKILFYRPSDRKMDRTINFETEDNVVDLPLHNLAAGQWDLVTEWESNKKQYQHKQQIIMP